MTSEGRAPVCDRGRGINGPLPTTFTEALPRSMRRNPAAGEGEQLPELSSWSRYRASDGGVTLAGRVGPLPSRPPPVALTMPRVRFPGCAAAVHGSRLYVWGGMGRCAGAGCGPMLLRFPPHRRPPPRAPAWCSNGSARTDSRVDDLLSADLNEDGTACGQWVREEQRGTVPPARSLHTLSCVGDELWLVGGARGRPSPPGLRGRRR